MRRWLRDWGIVIVMGVVMLAAQALAIAVCGYGWQGFGR